ncbi:MAG: class I SAM-dependent methyltransferase [Thermoproteota archaeon]
MKLEIISAFNSQAEEYDEWYQKKSGSLIFESEVKAIKALNTAGLGVEVGVGTGVFSSRLDVFLGVDPSSEMLKIANKRGVNLVQSLSEFLPIKRECFDYALLIFTICFLRDPHSSLREIWKVLKPKGHLILCFVPRNSEWGIFYSKRKTEGHRLYRHANFYTLQEVKEILRKAGFKANDYTATLSQRPQEVHKVEEPSCELTGRGIVCIKATKIK